jgi:alkylation response protein AidB-like acyl-CoA dehydrogenase
VSESDSIVRDTATRIFADLTDPQTLNRAKTDAWKAPLWAALEEAGLTLAWVSEQHGGAGAGLAEGFEVLRVCGHYAAPVPIAETLLAGHFLDTAGLAAPQGMLTLAPVRLGDALTLGDDGTISGTARAVPHASDARAVVVIARRGGRQVVALMPPGSFTAAPRAIDMGGERCDLSFDRATPLATAPAPESWHADTPMLLGAAVRAVQMTGALESVLALSARYAQEREQFGRPIGKFQAIQHNLARLAGEVAAALAASGSAADALARGEAFDQALFLEIASAKIRVGEAAAEGARIAHQVHGAIGWTAEHVLQRYTRRLWGWRDDFGAESHWAARLGAMVTEAGPEALWPLIAAR